MIADELNAGRDGEHEACVLYASAMAQMSLALRLMQEATARHAVAMEARHQKPTGEEIAAASERLKAQAAAPPPKIILPKRN